MKGRSIAIVAAMVLAVGLCAGALSLPASAAGSTLTSSVFDASSNAAWTGSEVVGASAYDTAQVVGDGSLTPTGSVLYSFFTNGTCTGTPTTTDTEQLDGQGDVPNSTSTGPLAAGTYSFSAVYSGGNGNSASDPANCNTFTLTNQATPTTATVVNDAASNTAWSGNELVGASAYATASVTGVAGVTPTGNVTYALFDNGTCANTPATTQQVTLAVDGSVPNSNATGALAAGNYSFDDVYGGDASYGGPVTSTCEPFSVGLLPATTNTTVFDATSNAAWGGSETTGANAYDTATVAGNGMTMATGTVTYSFFGNGSCSGSPVTTDPVSLSDGLVPNSAATGPLGGGSYSFDAVYGGDTNYSASPVSNCESFTVARTPSSTSTVVFDASTNTAWGGGEVTGASAYDTATVGGVSGFTPGGTVTYSFYRNGVCTGGAVTSDPVTLSSGAVPNSSATVVLNAGAYSFNAVYGGDGNYNQSAPSACESFSVGKATPLTVSTVMDVGSSGPWTDMELTNARAEDTATVTGTAGIAPTGSVSYTFYANSSCSDPGTNGGTSAIGGLSTATGPLNAGDYSYLATYNGDSNYILASGACEEFSVARNPAPGPPNITNLPAAAVYGGNFSPAYFVQTDGAPSATSSTSSVCVVSNSAVLFVGVGTCTLTAHTMGTPNFGASDGSAQSFSVGRGTPVSPTIANIPGDAIEFTSFVASIFTNGDGAGTVSSNSDTVCSVGSDGRTVTFVSFGTCSLTPSVGQGTNFIAGTGSPQIFLVAPAARGYWLVGSDGGIFSFGAAAFHGSMGSTPLQRPVVGITPTASRNGYWLVASDGGIFSFGDSSYYGSIPGVGLHPAGSGQPNSLNAPIVGMVPSTTGHGYFMVASDGGVFAFGDAHFAGSCPGIGGCHGSAVSVMPDRTGNGYWLVTTLGSVYAFGDAGNYGEPPTESVPVVDAVASPDGLGYWLLYSNGAVIPFGDATSMGAPLGYVNGFNPAASIFPTADGRGYWVASARGDVFCYGDAPYLGGEAAAGLNGQIIAAFGF